MTRVSYYRTRTSTKMSPISECLEIRRPVYLVQHQVQLIVVLMACLLTAHLALFQSVNASVLSTSLKLSSPLGSDHNELQRETARGQAVISSVPEEEREIFILYHLAKALSSATANATNMAPRFSLKPQIPPKYSIKYKDIRTYDTFSTDLLEWTQRTFGLSQDDVYILVRRCRVFCTIKGLCFNPNDIGSMCCPF